MEKPKILIGDRFGKLIVIERSSNDSSGKSMWICKCDCGEITKPIYASNLKYGRTISCGCHRNYVLNSLAEKSRTHGMTNTRLYTIWTSMKVRCYNKNCDAYNKYGGRGITICDEWKNDFSAFMKWAYENGYSEELTIDRINVNGNYEPDNCRWATYKTQANNTRKNKYLTLDGKTMTMKQWSEYTGIRYGTLYRRLKDGWSVKSALTIPITRRNMSKSIRRNIK